MHPIAPAVNPMVRVERPREVSKPSEIRQSDAGSVVVARRTESTPDQIRLALAKALEELPGESPEGLLDVLVAHVAHETANGRRMYNYNFGGIKGRAPDGAMAVYRTHERVGGRSVAIRDGFRAYRSIEEGAKDYVSLLARRYPKAIDAAADGGPRAFAVELHRGRYFTDSPASYARNLERLHGQLGGQTDWQAPASPVIELTALPGVTARGAMVSHVSSLPTLGVIRAIDDATSHASRLAATSEPMNENDTTTLKRHGDGPFPETTGTFPGPSGRRHPS
jgi:Mannosyl-glycoprotein endo-beta-N-acetylglucosaminidase